jgi:hypothetical protein
MVMRETPNRLTNSASLGSLAPAGYSPEARLSFKLSKLNDYRLKGGRFWERRTEPPSEAKAAERRWF